MVVASFTSFASSSVHAQESIFERGNQLYQEADYTGAIETYEAVLSAGFESADLHYNLGNAYFKEGDLGHHSSVIHYLTGRTPIEEGVLLVDWGATVDGYRSDMTRTFGVGSLPDKIAELYDIVLEAQQAAITACAPGKSCAEIDGIARGIIDRAGYGESFGHGLGHGLGLDIHEAPFFNQQSTDIVLEAGMVMTVEPGIYLPGVGGVRIEDDVLITDHGHRVLTSFPRDPSQAVLEPLGVGG